MKKAMSAAALALGAWVGIRYLLPICLPFALGALLALAAEPGVRFLVAKLHLPRAAASAVGVGAVFAAICAVGVLVLGLAVRELGALAATLPRMELTAKRALETLRLWLLGLTGRASPGVRTVLTSQVNELFSGGTALLDRLTRYGLSLAGNFLTRLPDSALGLGTAVLASFLTSAELPNIREWMHGNAPGGMDLPGFLERLRSTAFGWLLAQLKLTGVTFLLLTAGFLLLRVEYAPLWAMAVCLVDALPILGTGAVLLPWSVLCLALHDGSRALGLLGLYILVSVTRSALEPKLVGRQLGLDPLVTLIALYAGFRLGGLLGMMLSPLVAIAVMSLWEHRAAGS